MLGYHIKCDGKLRQLWEKVRKCVKYLMRSYCIFLDSTLAAIHKNSHETTGRDNRPKNNDIKSNLLSFLSYTLEKCFVLRNLRDVQDMHNRVLSNNVKYVRFDLFHWSQPAMWSQRVFTGHEEHLILHILCSFPSSIEVHIKINV